MTITIRPFRSGGWEVDIVLPLPNSDKPYRDRVKAPVASKSDAKKWGRARESAALEYILKHGEAPPKKRGKAAKQAEEVTTKQIPTVAEFAPRYMEKHTRANREKPSTIKSKESIFRNHLIPMLGDRRLDQISIEDVQDIKLQLEDRNPKTVNNVLSVLNSVLAVAKEWGEIEVVPVKAKWLKTTQPKIEFYDFDVYDRLRAAAHLIDPRAELVVLLGGDAGLRCGEIRALQRKSIDFTNWLLTVERSYSDDQIVVSKSDKIRVVPMTPRLVAALQNHPSEDHENVLLDDDDGPPNKHTIRKWLAWAQKRAGLPEKGPHTLRHTFCSHLAMRGAHIMEIKELAGHADIETTQRYMHLSPRALREAIDRLDGAPKQPLGDAAETSPGSHPEPL